MKKLIFILIIIPFVANAQVSTQKSTNTADRLAMNTQSKKIVSSTQITTNDAALVIETNESAATATNKQEVYTALNGCSAGESYMLMDADFSKAIVNEQKKSEKEVSSSDETMNLTNAIKELKKENETLKKANEIANTDLKKQNEALRLLVKKVAAIEDLLDFAHK